MGPWGFKRTFEGDNISLDSSGNVAFQAGSASAPSLHFTGDTNTGIYAPAADSIAVVTGGSARTTVDSSGRLLVGETSSTQAGSIDAKAQIVSNDFNAALTVRRNQTGDGAPGMMFCKSRGTSNSANVVVNSGDGLGNIRFFGADATGGNDFAEGGAISCVVDGTPGSNDMPGRLEFKTTSDGSDGPTTRMRITSNGSVLVDCISLPGGSTQGFGFYPDTNVVQLLSASGSTSATAHAEFFNPNGKVGTITTDGTSTSYNQSSDYRLKENVVDLDGAIDRVKQLAPKRFNFIADANKTVDGFLAHEAQAVVPEAVFGAKDAVDADGNPEYQGIDQSKLVPLLTAALQEAVSKIETLEAANTSQAATIAALDARLTALEG